MADQLTENRAALIVGGSRGIGLAIAHLLGAEGYGVTVAARHQPDLDEAVAGLEAEGVDAQAVAGDISNDEWIRELLERHHRRFGGLDVLVVSAGSGRPTALASLDAEWLDRMIAVNLRGPAMLLARALPALREAGARHRQAMAVVISSISGHWPVPGFAGYSATKAALVSLARSVNVEAAEHGVRACALCPAYVDTAMTAWTAETIPPKTMLRAQDIAEAVRFLLRLSPNAIVDDLTIRRIGTGPLSP